ncbi:MAG: aminotransferase class I/II-fold pyridoxal phosphate-dependent enzyme [Gammaproteobacteria bacterium]|nr:aminotransferase class I/II-fold pyridoxal phosphate-dependent enzyme [Gammaproteobacteria bacterium]
MKPTDELREIAGIFETYLEQADSRPSPIKITPLKELINSLQAEKWVKQGGLQGDALKEFLPLYLDAAINLRHPHNMNHQVSVPVEASGTAGAITGMLSNPMNIYEMGPGAAALEFFLINYFLQIVGWQPQVYPDEEQIMETGGGVLTHGGSLANLTALVAARSRWQRAQKDAAKSASSADSPNYLNGAGASKPIILCSDVSHYSIAKSTFIMGMECRSMPSDECGRTKPQALTQAINECAANNESIVAVVASICNTPVGYFDPLEELAAICDQHNLWLHADGAHGASLLLSPKYKHLLKGIDKVASVTWDAHKMLRTNGVCTMLLVRDRADLDLAFNHDASYLFHDKDQTGFDFLNRSFECTKAGIGFNFFHALAYQGIDAVGSYVTDLCDITLKAFEIFSDDNFHCALEPQCNVLCFRPSNDMDDATILRLRDRLMDAGYPISSTVFKDTRWLRLAIMSPKTKEQHLTQLHKKILEFLPVL